MTSKLLPILRCPRCAPAGGGVLSQEGGALLRCVDCGMTYPVQDGLPIMVTPEGEFAGVPTERGR